MEFTKDFDPITIDDIRELEKKLEFKLPSEYVSFLLENNGGTPSSNIFWISDDEKQSIVTVFFGITNIEDDDVYDIYSNFYFEGRPDGILFIGRDPGGNFIGIGVDSSNFGRIFFFDHETDNVIPIGKDLPSFLDSLYDTPRR